MPLEAKIFLSKPSLQGASLQVSTTASNTLEFENSLENISSVEQL